MNMPLPTPPITYNGNSVLLHGQALFARHIATALKLSQRPEVQSAGFVAELISVEQTRCGATFDALASLCPAVSAELKDAYDAAVIEMRTIRHNVLDTLKAPEGKAGDHGGAPVDLTA